MLCNTCVITKICSEIKTMFTNDQHMSTHEPPPFPSAWREECQHSHLLTWQIHLSSSSYAITEMSKVKRPRRWLINFISIFLDKVAKTEIDHNRKNPDDVPPEMQCVIEQEDRVMAPNKKGLWSTFAKFLFQKIAEKHSSQELFQNLNEDKFKLDMTLMASYHIGILLLCWEIMNTMRLQSKMLHNRCM